jgi:hypothetical protein
MKFFLNLIKKEINILKKEKILFSKLKIVKKLEWKEK